MLDLLARFWWALALRGLFAVLFGLLAIFMPHKTLLVLVLLFGVYAFLDGIFDLVSAVRSPRHHWAFLLEGIVGIIAGVANVRLAPNNGYGAPLPDCFLGDLYWIV